MSWQQLLDLAAAAEHERRHPRPPSGRVCPADGQPLTYGDNGRWHCPWGDEWRTPVAEPDS